MAEKLTGPEKAAVLLISLGDELASDVLKNLDDKDIQLIGNYMTRAASVSSDSIDSVSEEFYREASSGEGGLVAGGRDYVKKVLEKALEPWKVQELMERMAFTGEEESGGGLDAIRILDAKTIANFMRNEHPQTCAIILAHLDPSHAAAVLKELPEKFQSEVALRMAVLERIPPGVIKELDEALAAEFRSAGAVEVSKIGGVGSVAEILNQMDHATEARIISEIEGGNPELAEEIRKLMFVFEDLIKVDDRGMQTILKDVSSQDLLIAIKTASEPLKAKIFANMSERAATMMKEDLEAMGPQRLSEVEKAQQNILKIAKKLEEEGKVVIGGAGEELV
jgi:flagellar motor switch protein FliG